MHLRLSLHKTWAHSWLAPSPLTTPWPLGSITRCFFNGIGVQQWILHWNASTLQWTTIYIARNWCWNCAGVHSWERYSWGEFTLFLFFFFCQIFSHNYTYEAHQTNKGWKCLCLCEMYIKGKAISHFFRSHTPHFGLLRSCECSTGPPGKLPRYLLQAYVFSFEFHWYCQGFRYIFTRVLVWDNSYSSQYRIHWGYRMTISWPICLCVMLCIGHYFLMVKAKFQSNKVINPLRNIQYEGASVLYLLMLNELQ